MIYTPLKSFIFQSSIIILCFDVRKSALYSNRDFLKLLNYKIILKLSGKTTFNSALLIRIGFGKMCVKN